MNQSDYEILTDNKNISGRLFTELNSFGNLKSGLVFGCGIGVFPYLVKRSFDGINLTAYDIDERKISYMQDMHKKRIKNGIDAPVNFTTNPPSNNFDIVFGIMVFHENPDTLIKEALRYLNPDGKIAVIDYDMKNMPLPEFYDRWGFTRDEKDEESKMGKIFSHKLHTSTGIDDCISIMEKNGIETIVARGKQTSTWYCSPKPPLHYIYIGKKQQLQKEI